VWTRDAVAERFVGVQQDFFETTAEAHVFVRGQVVEQGREAFLEAHGDIDAFDLEGRSLVVDGMSEIEFVAAKVANPVVAQAIVSVAGRNDDLDAVGAMKFVEFIGIADDEIN